MNITFQYLYGTFSCECKTSYNICTQTMSNIYSSCIFVDDVYEVEDDSKLSMEDSENDDDDYEDELDSAQELEETVESIEVEDDDFGLKKMFSSSVLLIYPFMHLFLCMTFLSIHTSTISRKKQIKH